MITPRALSTGTHPGLQQLERRGYTLVCPTPGRTPGESDLIANIPGCIGWIAGVEPVSAAVIDAAERLVAISRNGTGIDNLPMPAIEARGIVVKRAQGANARGVAELALTLMLSAMRNVVQADAGIRAGGWPRLIGSEMSSATVGIVGLGAIGRELAHMCLALGAGIICFDPYAPQNLFALKARVERVGTLDQLVAASGIISLHAPMPADGQPLLTAELIAKLRPGAIVINTARAGLVDCDAMLAGLNAGNARCYATDVFHREPPGRTALLDHPGTIQTSHIGGFTRESVQRVLTVTVQNLLDALEGADA
ncbi:MAG: oxidoreductase [Rhodobacteraceae bacterium]|nr:oxidoreductase [Paracoccaceae bacterium]